MSTAVSPTNDNEVQSSPNNPKKEKEICCPEFSKVRIEKFDEKLVTFQDKSFVKEHVWCFWYMPLNFGQATARACAKIDATPGAAEDPEDFIMLSDMTSPWSTRIYLSVKTRQVEGAAVVHMTGKYLTKVFEGPYSHFGQWIKDMTAYVKREKGDDYEIAPDAMYAYYTTCPKCAAKYGKNYTVLFVKVE